MASSLGRLIATSGGTESVRRSDASTTSKLKTMRTIINKTINGDLSIRNIIEALDLKVPKEFNLIEEKQFSYYNDITFRYNIDDYQYKEIRLTGNILKFEERPNYMKYNFKVLNRIEFFIPTYSDIDNKDIINIIPKDLQEFDSIIDKFKYIPTNKNGYFTINQLLNKPI